MSRRQTPTRTCRKRRASPPPQVIVLDDDDDFVTPPLRFRWNGNGALNNQNNAGNIVPGRRVGLPKPRPGPGNRNQNLSQNQENGRVGGRHPSMRPLTNQQRLLKNQKARERRAEAKTEELKKKLKVEITWNPPCRQQAAVSVQDPSQPLVAPQNMIPAPVPPVLRPPPPQVLQQNVVQAPAQILPPPPLAHPNGIPGTVVRIREQGIIRLMQNQHMGPPPQPGPRPSVSGGFSLNHLPRPTFIDENFHGPNQRLPPNNPPPPDPVAGISRIPGNNSNMTAYLREKRSKLEAYVNSQEKSIKMWFEFATEQQETWEKIDGTRKRVLQDFLHRPDSVPSKFLSLLTHSPAYHTRHHTKALATCLGEALCFCAIIDQAIEDEINVLETESSNDAAKDPVNAPIKPGPSTQSRPE